MEYVKMNIWISEIGIENTLYNGEKYRQYHYINANWFYLQYVIMITI